jgi:ABC-type phosphate transport system substrate-binding protein
MLPASAGPTQVRKQWCCVALCAVGLLCAPAASADVVVVVSAKSSIASLKADQVADIFLGKRSAYPDGADAVPIDQPESSSSREAFYTALTGKTPALLKAYWSKLLFTGQGQPPRELPNADAVKKLIASNSRFIGYMDKDALDDNVKVVFVPR